MLRGDGGIPGRIFTALARYVTGVNLSVAAYSFSALREPKVGNVDKDDGDDDDDDEEERENRPLSHEPRREEKGPTDGGRRRWRTSKLLADLSSRRRASWVAGRGSISDTPDRSLCRRDPVSSPSPCSRRSHPEIISTIPFSFYPRLRSPGDATAYESGFDRIEGVEEMYNSEAPRAEHGQINRMIISLAFVLSGRISGISFPRER